VKFSFSGLDDSMPTIAGEMHGNNKQNRNLN